PARKFRRAGFAVGSLQQTQPRKNLRRAMRLITSSLAARSAVWWATARTAASNFARLFGRRSLAAVAARPPYDCASIIICEFHSSSGLDRQNGLDLDRDLPRQRAHADGGTCMAAGVAEHLDQQVGAAVDDLRLIGELRDGVDHAEQLHHVIDAVERAERVARRRQEPEADEPGPPVPLVHRDVLADLAGQARAFFVARPLAGQVEQVAHE